MKTRIFTMLSLVVFMALLLAVLPGGTRPTTAQEPEPPCPNNKSLSGYSLLPDSGPRRAPDGTWYMPADAAPLVGPSAPVAPQATGGPDDFGYTWDDSVAFSWIDATGGTNTGLTSKNQQVGPTALPFSFKYYENTYDQVYISTNGTLGFSGKLTQRSQEWVFPNPSLPNNVIAPYWAPEDASTGGVYYTSGGTAPNRWWMVEWYQVRDYEADSRLTLEAVLFENGDIEFRYHTIDYGAGGSQWGYGVGIEDSDGLDGAKYTGYARDNLAIHFTRPPASARVSLSPKHAGTFSRPGATMQFNQIIRNNGEFGTDTYDFFVSSLWSVSLYAADGTTSLTDTDGDGTVDTGSVAQGGAVTVTVKVATPAGAVVGDDNTAAVTVRSSLDTGKSKTVYLQTTVPAPFAQVYRDDADSAMSLYLVQPGAQTVKKATSNWYYGDYMAVAEMPDSFAYIWTKYHWAGSVGTSSIEYTLLDRYGETVRGVSKLTNHAGATVNTYDYNPTVAVAPNGRIGVVWYRYLWNSSTQQFNYNIYFAILDSSGNLAYGPVNLTNNNVWGNWDDLNVPRFYNPRIAATGDNHFVLVWQREHQESAGYVDDIYYTIRGSSGGEGKPITQLTFDTSGWAEGYYGPNLARLTGNRVLFIWHQGSDGNIYYSVLDSGGNTVKSATNLSTDYGGWGPDAVQLSNGNIVVAWSGSMHFAVLDGNYNRIAGPTTLSNPAAVTGDAYVSVAADGDGHAILTWMDSDWSYRRNLYYALVDGNGNVLTDPIIFRTSQATDPYIGTSYEGYGNTSYSWTPPSDVDGVAAFSASLFGGAPGGNAAVGVRYTNHGATIATNVDLTATLDSNLTYVSDTSGVVPTVSGNDVVWSLPDLDLLESHDFTLYVQVPSGAAYGTRYPVTLTMTSDGPEANVADNTDSAEVMVARQVFLPLVSRGY